MLGAIIVRNFNLGSDKIPFTPQERDVRLLHCVRNDRVFL